MSKIEINKEIVLLRKSVEQAKVHVIKKHTREIMKLRNYKGPESQKNKRLRKAGRRAAEILAIKNVKNDEITKYVLTHPLNLKQVLNDRQSQLLTRIMARIANHKTFSQKIDDLKKKYPNYIQFLEPGRKKKAIIEWKEKKKLKKKEANLESFDQLSENEESEDFSEEEISESKESDAESSSESVLNKTEQLQNEIKDSKKEKNFDKKIFITDIKKIVKNNKNVVKNLEKEKTENVSTNNVGKKAKTIEKVVEGSDITGTLQISKSEKAQKRKKEASETKQDIPSPKKTKKKKKTDITKVISKQAVVKKFTEILKEDKCSVDKEEIDKEAAEPSIQVEKEEDPFFVTGDGRSNYFSVALIKTKSDNQRNDYDEDEDGSYGSRLNKQKLSRQDKYFNKLPKFKNGNSEKANTRWDGPKRNGKTYDKEKPGRNANFSKLNDKQRDKSKPFRKQSKGGIESTSNEILHPSWEAKKKQQEALKKGFQGKKIVFGDDDV
ncbi:serum response factor-binding protein 1 [Phymastichus coffea]|uniref:serum response factor-binding protein 1 n=1 Tax=Phymastichus coffea TaxID=108790 RepID=UPI00273CDC74|nr:serum response factor-binding protein 1 [Phymastichus coffea]